MVQVHMRAAVWGVGMNILGVGGVWACGCGVCGGAATLLVDRSQGRGTPPAARLTPGSVHGNGRALPSPFEPANPVHGLTCYALACGTQIAQYASIHSEEEQKRHQPHGKGDHGREAFAGMLSQR